MVSPPPSTAAKSQPVEPLQKRAVGFTHAGLGVLQHRGGLRPRREPAERRSPGGMLPTRVGLGREQGGRLVARFCGLMPSVFSVLLPSVCGLQDRPACAQTLMAASQNPTAVTDHRHTFTLLPVCPGLRLIPSSGSAPSWIWGLVVRLSLFLLDLQDLSLFFYFNILL